MFRLSSDFFCDGEIHLKELTFFTLIRTQTLIICQIFSIIAESMSVAARPTYSSVRLPSKIYTQTKSVFARDLKLYSKKP